MSTMELHAVKLIDYKNKQGTVWYKGWHLQDLDTHKVYGMMVYNQHWQADQQFAIYIFNPIHQDLGNQAAENFATRAEALAWARKQIEELKQPTFVQLKETLERIKEGRYQDEMSDDFAYSNGKIARWDFLERLVNAMLDKAA